MPSFQSMIISPLAAILAVFALTTAHAQGNHPTCRPFQIIGTGVVVGLNGTGDNLSASPFTGKSLQLHLDAIRGGALEPSKYDRRAASVMVTGTIHICFSEMVRPSENWIDLRLASTGDAFSLQGGALLMAPLYTPDGKVYAVGQGVLQPCTGSQSKTEACIPGGGITSR